MLPDPWRERRGRRERGRREEKGGREREEKEGRKEKEREEKSLVIATMQVWNGKLK